MHNLLFLFLPILLAAACSSELPAAADEAPVATFVGSSECGTCHDVQFNEWQGSHHQLAMQVASTETVLGNFDNVSFDYFDSITRFTTEDGRFYIETDNAEGAKQKFEISHTFGVTPLQQYLVDMPGGRKQALPLAWDTRPAETGGQRWFHLYPDEPVDHNDPLHWTGRYFNWNSMCAECHSTDVDPGYDMNSNSFATTFEEISVGCEACHGPGSKHIAQAETGSFSADRGLLVNLDDRQNASWVIDPGSGNALRSAPNTSKQQPESCGRCHARRSVIAKDYEYGKALSDTHSVSLLDEHLYHADGRILDEVYVYGSFVQSKMYAAGVTCTDCHNPHSGQLQAGPDPDNTCALCHLPARFAVEDHAGTPAGQCVDCHMAAKTYMGVDERRDHSFRLPNTASDPEHYGNAIAAGRAGNANPQLLDVIANDTNPAIARATLLTLLEPDRSADTVDSVTAKFSDPDPLVRVAALRAVRNSGADIDITTGSRLLRDDVRAVRIEAVRTYVHFRDLLPAADTSAFNVAADEYREALSANASSPEAALSLAEFESRLGNVADARKLYKQALLVGPDFAPAHHAYAMWLIRSGEREPVLDYLHRAVELAPEVARYHYVYGVALNSFGQADAALRVLRNANRTFENDFDIAWALATIYRDRGDRQLALALAKKLQKTHPSESGPDALIRSLSTDYDLAH